MHLCLIRCLVLKLEHSEINLDMSITQKVTSQPSLVQVPNYLALENTKTTLLLNIAMPPSPNWSTQGRMTLNHNALEHQQNKAFVNSELHLEMSRKLIDNQDFLKHQSKDSMKLSMLQLALDLNLLLRVLLDQLYQTLVVRKLFPSLVPNWERSSVMISYNNTTHQRKKD